MVRGQRASALRDQVRHRHLGLAARLRHRVDDVVGVLLERVVHARVALRRSRAVVIDAEPTAHVDVRELHAHFTQFDVKAGNFLQPGLDEPDVRDLRTEMEVDELEDFELSRLAKAVDEFDELRRIEPELALLPGTLRPTPGAFGRELHPHADRRAHLQLRRDLEQHVQLRQLLDDDEDLVPDLLPHEGEAHELVVLVPVADDQVIRVLGDREHRLQLGLGTALEPNPIRTSVLEDLLDDMALLVDLDRIHGRVPADVLVLAHRRLEAFAQLRDAGAQDVAEAQEHREGDALLFEIAREVEQVELELGSPAIRADDDAPTLVHVEIARTPAFDVVQRARVIDRPRRRLRYGATRHAGIGGRNGRRAGAGRDGRLGFEVCRHAVKASAPRQSGRVPPRVGCPAPVRRAPRPAVRRTRVSGTRGPRATRTPRTARRAHPRRPRATCAASRA